MKALTLHQPWATAVAEGIKTIETRSWSTSYRGPLAIHAGVSVEGLRSLMFDYEDGWAVGEIPDTEQVFCWQRIDGQQVVQRYDGNGSGPFVVPLGAVVAVANLVDVVPIGGPMSFSTGIFEGEEPPTAGMDVVVHHPALGGWSPELVLDRWHGPTEDISSQLPWGDFTPGRWAWLLEDVRKLDEPIPAKGRQGLWEWDESAVEA
jgi:hypothetical protein